MEWWMKLLAKSSKGYSHMTEQLKNCQLLQTDKLLAFSLLSITVMGKIHSCEESP